MGPLVIGGRAATGDAVDHPSTQSSYRVLDTDRPQPSNRSTLANVLATRPRDTGAHPQIRDTLSNDVVPSMPANAPLRGA